MTPQPPQQLITAHHKLMVDGAARQKQQQHQKLPQKPHVPTTSAPEWEFPAKAHWWEQTQQAVLQGFCLLPNHHHLHHSNMNNHDHNTTGTATTTEVDDDDNWSWDANRMSTRREVTTSGQQGDPQLTEPEEWGHFCFLHHHSSVHDDDNDDEEEDETTTTLIATTLIATTPSDQQLHDGNGSSGVDDDGHDEQDENIIVVIDTASTVAGRFVRGLEILVTCWVLLFATLCALRRAGLVNMEHEGGWIITVTTTTNNNKAPLIFAEPPLVALQPLMMSPIKEMMTSMPPPAWMEKATTCQWSESHVVDARGW